MQLLELLVDVRLARGVAEVGVDLDLGQGADRHGIEPQRQVVLVRGDDEAAARDLVAHELRRKRFTLRHAPHLLGDLAVSRHMELGYAGHRSGSFMTSLAGITRIRSEGCDLSPSAYRRRAPLSP